MKLAFLILAAALNPVHAGDRMQTNQPDNSGVLSIPSTASTNQPGGIRPWNPGPDAKRFTWNNALTNLPVVNFPAGKQLPAQDGKPPPPELLPPGVYKTYPYTLLVLVPGRQHDDNGLLKSGTAEPKQMPILSPGLKFIPYSAAEK